MNRHLDWWLNLPDYEKRELDVKYPDFAKGIDECGEKAIHLVWLTEMGLITPMYIERLSDGVRFKVSKLVNSNDGDVNVWCNDWYGHHIVGFDCKIISNEAFAKRFINDIKSMATEKLNRNKDRPLSESAIEARTVIDVCNGVWSVLNGI